MHLMLTRLNPTLADKARDFMLSALQSRGRSQGSTRNFSGRCFVKLHMPVFRVCALDSADNKQQRVDFVFAHLTGMKGLISTA